MKRRKFIYQTSIGLAGLLPVVNSLEKFDERKGPFLATGMKIGEVTDKSAIIWTRLTNDNKPVGKNAVIPKVLYLDDANGEWQPVNYFKTKYKQDRPDRQVKLIYPEGYDVTNIDMASPGMMGEVRAMYRTTGETRWSTTNWTANDTSADFSAQIKLQNLAPGTSYEVKVEARSLNSKTVTAILTGKFATSPLADSPKSVHFMVTTCHEYNDQDDPSGGGFKIYKHMQSLNPDFMVHTGDVIYYDQLAKTLPLAHWHWQRMFGLTNCIEFYRNVPCYFMKDDHDTWMNDCYPQSKNKFMGDFKFHEGVRVFKQQVPYSDKPYRTFRWGKDLQVWLMEGREYRTSNDLQDGPDKTIWGKEQMAWFKETFSASDATYRVLATATPIVGPDRPQKKDNHANSGFAYEGALIREFLAKHKNIFIVCGDRHWQYASQDGKTGLMEFSCGPASDEHASGWKKEDVLPEHHYLNIVGGFLSVNVHRENNNSNIVFTHYGVNGDKLYTKNYSTQI